MSLFVHILLTITAPLVVIVLIGWLAQAILSLDVENLKEFQLNIVLPAFFIHYLATADLPLLAAWPTSWFTVLQFIILLALGWGIARIFGLSAVAAPVAAIALAFPNTGNYGVPLATLVFDPQFLLHQAVIVAAQTFLIITGCELLLRSRRDAGSGLAGALKAIAISPMIWGIVIGLALRGFEAQLPSILAIPTEMVGSTYAAIALFTLGASLRGTATIIFDRTIQIVVWGKLLLAPAITWALAWACGFTGETLVFLIIAASTPVGVMLAIFCLADRTEASIASPAVFLSTLISPLTITGWLVALRALGV
ncbi:MAG: AEC family transporter [Pseudomonadota bacterium]